MKYLARAAVVLTFIYFAGCNANAGSEELKWNDRVESAVNTARSERKAILINFTGSDWCQWCKKLNAEVFTQKEFVDYAKKNLVLVRIDFPRNIPQSNETIFYNRQLAQKFGIEGFPTIVLLNSQGVPVAFTGYRSGGAAAYVEHIESLVDSKSRIN